MRALTAQLRTELVLASRRGEGILITLVVPLALLLFFVGVAPPPTGATNPLDFLVPGVLALAVMSTSMVSLGIATAYERYYGALKRLVGSPLPRSTLLLAKTLSVLLIEALQAAVLMLVARFVFGWQPSGGVVAVVGTILVLLVGSVAFAGLGLLMAGALRAEATLALANGLYLAFLLLGGFVFPIDRLPGPLAAVATVLPAGALSDATRAAATGSLSEIGPPLVLLAGWAVVTSALAAISFRAE